MGLYVKQIPLKLPSVPWASHLTEVELSSVKPIWSNNSWKIPKDLCNFFKLKLNGKMTILKCIDC